MMNPVVHFELPGTDMERMKKFYGEAFGWQLNQLGAEMGNYVMATTSETKPDGFPTEPGRINGGLYQKTADAPHPSVVIGVEDVQHHVKKVEEAGGTILTQPMMIPGVGMFASFQDTEGNRLSILQPLDMTAASA